jgi:Phosphate-starvation-inducible E family
MEDGMAIKPHTSRKLLAETREQWPLMSLYDRFEQVVAVVLSLVIAVVIALALVQLVIRVVPLLLSGAADPLDHDVFQTLFGMVMTLLIALEFKHSIIRVALRRGSIRHERGYNRCAGGRNARARGVYWLLRERDDRLAGAEREESGSD